VTQTQTKVRVELPRIYGNNAAAYDCHDRECILAGGADTGKTVAFLSKLHFMAYKYPKSSQVILRKQLTDIYSTALVTFKDKILGDNGHGVTAYGGEKPQWFDYPNGSRIWVAGLDKSGKVLSAEFDCIYAVQAEELSLGDWETLSTRTTGRAGNFRWPQIIGCCNPRAPSHWIKTRAASGKLTLFNATHRDNPEIYDPATGELTESGARRLDALKNLTGTRLLRLYHGLWVQPEGAIYSMFVSEDAAGERAHVIKHFEPHYLWPRLVAIDPMGAHVAALWLAYDPGANIFHVYREYREPFGLSTPAHVKNIIHASQLATGQRETIFAWVGGGPSERQARADWAAAGIPLLDPGIPGVWAGIERVQRLMQNWQLLIHDNCPNLLSELGEYQRKMTRDGIITDVIVDKDIYDMLDCLRYGIGWWTAPAESVQMVDRSVRIGPRL